MSNLTVSLSPHVRAQSSTRRIMLDVLIALIPAVVFAVYWFGFSVLVTILLSMAAAIGSEALMQKALRRPITVDDGSAAVTGLLLALTEIYQKKSKFYKKHKKDRWYLVASWFVTFNLVMFGFFIFSGRLLEII